MKIFIESSSIFGERSGIGQYTKRLVEAYHQYYPKVQLRLFGFKFISRKFQEPIGHDASLRYKLIRWLPGRAYTGAFKQGVNIPMDVLVGARRRDVFLYPNFVKWPHLYNRKAIAFIHDVSFITHGQYTSPANRVFMLKYVPRTVSTSQHIVTISECSKQAIATHYGVKPKDISIVHPFVDTQVFYKTNIAAQNKVRKKYHLPKKYLLFIGNVEPRKNLTGVLSAYESLSTTIKNEYGLVIAGGKGWLNDAIHRKIDRLISEGHTIVRTGYIADEDVPSLMSAAKLFIFIPHYEGFGIPPLESMACGVPVICADNSSLPEAAGDAVLYVDASKPHETTLAIEKLINDKKIYDTLVARGYKQVQKFTPKISAEQLHAAIQKVV